MKLKISDESSLAIDLPVLMKTRLLIQANSGGGKSWLLRRLAEQMFGKVQVIIIDPEGEFSTLREKFDYVLVGKGGETPADCRSAGLVAHKLLELHASAVCDLYEMKPQERHHWVRLFLDALIDAPKNLWHPVVVIVDESHVFCPESKAGESEASGSMIDLATRGRKRGYCAIFATQRLGKLKKDAAAELTNVMIGQTFIDIDRDRAADCLGVSGKERHAFDDEIKTIEQGNFFALGRAICTTRTKVLVGSVQTTHPEIGGKKFSTEPPPPSEKVKLMMPKLADLPKAAEEKARTETELRTEIRSLKAQLKTAPQAAPVEKSITSIKNVPALTDAERKRLTKLIDTSDKITGNLEKLGFEFQKFKTYCGAEFIFFKDLLAGKLSSPPLRATGQHKSEHTVALVKRQPVTPIGGKFWNQFRQPTIHQTADVPENVTIGKCERAIMSALAQYPQGRSAVQIALLSEYSVNSGGFNNSLGKLRSLGFITRNQPIQITPEGLAALGKFEPLPVGVELAQHWIAKLPKCEAAILKFLVDNHPNEFMSQAVADEVGYSANSGGFNNSLGRLRTLELITRGQPMKASDEFFQ